MSCEFKGSVITHGGRSLELHPVFWDMPSAELAHAWRASGPNPTSSFSETKLFNINDIGPFLVTISLKKRINLVEPLCTLKLPVAH